MTEMISMVRTHQNHAAGLLGSPHSGSGRDILALQKTLGAEDITRGGTFEQAMLQALDNVSGRQMYASNLHREAIVNPGSLDIHDITIAQAEANMALGITRNILSRLVQSWRDLINTR